MAAHQVTAQFVAEPQRALEVELRALPPGAGGGHAQRLGGHIHRKEAPVILPPTGDHGQARTRASDRGADIDGAGIVTAGDGQPPQPVGLLVDFNNLA